MSGWETLAPIARGPLQENAVVALDGEVFVIGGYDEEKVVDRVEAYDPSSDSWRDVAPLPGPRHHVNAAQVGGKIYVLGGLVTNGFNATGESFVYDPSSDGWSPIASMPAGTERGGAAVGVIGTEIYVAGGYRNGSVVDFSTYDTASDMWTVHPALPSPRDHLVGGAIGGVFYAVGGRVGSLDNVMAPVDVFDPASGSWTVGAEMLTPRAGCAAAVLGTELFVFGGEGDTSAVGGVFDEVEAYDAASDTWTAHPPMVTPRHGTGAAAIDGVIYVPGGADTQAFAAVNVNEAYRP